MVKKKAKKAERELTQKELKAVVGGRKATKRKTTKKKATKRFAR